MIYLILILALIGIIYGANNLVNGASSIAHRYNVSDFIIGALIVGVGTSTPELITSLISTCQNNPDIAIGNVVGSNIFNILGILGLTAIIFPIPIKKENVTFDITYCLGFSILLTAIVFTFGLDAFGGILLFMLFWVYTLVAINTDIVSPNTKKIEPLWQSILKIVGGLTILIISCDCFIDNSVLLARSFGLDDATISLTLIACGTSLPELASSIVAAFKKNTQLALGNIIGSNIFNIAFILGLCSMVTPLNSPNIGPIDYIVMIGAVVITFICGIFGKINRFAGFLMVGGFAAYIYYLLNF